MESNNHLTINSAEKPIKHKAHGYFNLQSMAFMSDVFSTYTV